MNAFIRRLYNNLKENNLLETWTETVTKTEEVRETKEKYVGIASDGTRYDKKSLFQYLTQQNYPATQDFIDLFAKMFPIDENRIQLKTHTITTEHTIEHNEFENVYYEDTNAFLCYKILEQLVQLKQSIIAQNFMDYAVEVINDNQTGATDTAKLVDVLNKRSKNGWKLVNTFTNELGVNSHVERHTLSNDVKVNSTIDQIIMIFERPISMTDEKAQEIINQIKADS